MFYLDAHTRRTISTYRVLTSSRDCSVRSSEYSSSNVRAAFWTFILSDIFPGMPSELSIAAAGRVSTSSRKSIAMESMIRGVTLGAWLEYAAINAF